MNKISTDEIAQSESTLKDPTATPVGVHKVVGDLVLAIVGNLNYSGSLVFDSNSNVATSVIASVKAAKAGDYITVSDPSNSSEWVYTFDGFGWYYRLTHQSNQEEL